MEIKEIRQLIKHNTNGLGNEDKHLQLGKKDLVILDQFIIDTENLLKENEELKEENVTMQMVINDCAQDYEMFGSAEYWGNKAKQLEKQLAITDKALDKACKKVSEECIELQTCINKNCVECVKNKYLKESEKEIGGK